MIRGERVMLDRDLAEIYGVETRVLNQSVKRNIERFPERFMFQLSKEEFEILKSQFVTSSWGGTRKSPNVFTEHGALMLSSVLKSEQAIHVSIQIIEAFTKLRNMLASNDDLRSKLLAMERNYDDQFKVVFDAIKMLIDSPHPVKGKLGYKNARKKK